MIVAGESKKKDRSGVVFIVMSERWRYVVGEFFEREKSEGM